MAPRRVVDICSEVTEDEPAAREHRDTEPSSDRSALEGSDHDDSERSHPKVMPGPTIWNCPGCGARVALPPEERDTGEHFDSGRRDLLARALCCCWVADLSDAGVTHLLKAIMTGNGRGPGICRGVAAHAGTR